MWETDLLNKMHVWFVKQWEQAHEQELKQTGRAPEAFWGVQIDIIKLKIMSLCIASSFIGIE